MSDQCGFSNDGTESTGPHKSNYGDDHMKKKREDVAHGGMVSKLESPAIQGNCGIRQVQAAGYRHFRFNVGGDLTASGGTSRPSNVLHSGPLFDRNSYIRAILKTFEGLRKELGDEVELMNDVHERITPTQALQLCRDVEKFRPFFIEDPLSPEDNAYYRIIRQQQILWKFVDGSAGEEVLAGSERHLHLGGWSPKGDVLVATATDPANIWTVPTKNSVGSI